MVKLLKKKKHNSNKNIYLYG